MSRYPCAFGCRADFDTFGAAKDHAGKCPTRKARLAGLGTDLSHKVDNGKLTLDEAEAMQRARPALVL